MSRKSVMLTVDESVSLEQGQIRLLEAYNALVFLRRASNRDVSDLVIYKSFLGFIVGARDGSYQSSHQFFHIETLIEDFAQTHGISPAELKSTAANTLPKPAPCGLIASPPKSPFGVLDA